MPIKKQVQAAKTASTSTHIDNLDPVKVEESDTKLMNHMSPDTLIDPEDDKPGSTYSAITASTEEIDLPDDSLEDDEELDAASLHTPQDGEEVENNDTPNILTADEDEDEDEDEDDEDPDWDAPVEDEEEEFEAEDEEAVEDVGDVEDVAEEDETVASDAMPIVDVDGTDDSDVDNVVFASFGSRLMVIKGSRIIATMTKAAADAAKHADVYMSDQFQDVVASEMVKKGLRQGLTGMGFVMAKVDVTKQETVNARVERKVQAATAAVRKVSASKEAAFEQSLAIASVGIHRGFFKDQPNELKAALEKELQLAGLRGGAKLVERVFAAHGPSYAKAIVTLATKLSAMPQAVRDEFVAGLDMTSEDVDMVSDDELEEGVQIGADDDFNDDEFVDDVTTVTAALNKPGVPRQVVTAKTAGYSVAAASILNGEKSLF